MKAVLLPILFILCMKISVAQETNVISPDELVKTLSSNNGKTRLVNFWATWCKPCVDELPYFVKAAGERKADDVEFIFVSVDFQSQHNQVLEKEKQLGLKGSLIHLNATGNDWIDSVDKDWSGAIPYTLLILPNGKRISHYDQFETYEDLRSFINNANTN